MRIENLKMKCLYKKHRFSGKEDFSDMIDVITSQGGIDKIKIIPEYGDINDNTIKFLKVIGFDINTLNIEVGTIESGIALIKNGYNLYKTGSAWIPSIAKCELPVINEALNRGLDITKFSYKNHFDTHEAYNEFDDEYYTVTNPFSHFLKNHNNGMDGVFSKFDFICEDRLKLFLDKNILNKGTLKEFEREGHPLYYYYPCNKGFEDKNIERLMNLYQKVEINEGKIFEHHRQAVRNHIFKRQIELSENPVQTCKDIVELHNKWRIDIKSSDEILKPLIESVLNSKPVEPQIPQRVKFTRRRM
ncbi:hypothetical protein EZQ91_004551 [Escherichia coli]|nr:hypothetical protein [Escherichia coli]